MADRLSAKAPLRLMLKDDGKDTLAVVLLLTHSYHGRPDGSAASQQMVGPFSIYTEVCAD